LDFYCLEDEMKLELSTRYSPAEAESRWYEFWESNGFFHPEPNKSQTPYTIVIPPPNVTGMLTLGHVLNNTLQDILIRWRRMQGFNTLWVPGTDHAGIATQNVVEKELAKQNITRDDLGREKFVEHVWQTKHDHHGIITSQLKRLGCSCDWERERFTLDEGLSRAVREVFVHLYNKGLVYRDSFIINWCPRCRTALSDEESEHREIEGALSYIKYPIVGGDKALTVATTRPETMLGDTAVAVHPDDPRYRDDIGKNAMLPLMDREIPIIADEAVDPKFGTGAVKVTPSHDPNDFEIGRKHDLEFVAVIGEDGKMTEAAGKYAGLDRFECRKRVLKDLEELGLFVDKKPHVHSVGHCYRCDTIVEPYLSRQWFVRMKELAEPAIKAAREGKITFYPKRWTKVYFSWLENVRDWCISRQIWWGHRIPAYYCRDCDETIVAADPPEKCKCGSANIEQEEDVLDTWFSSWLWPFSTLGWPEKTPDLDYFYPTNALVTAPDIIFFWVARMIIAGLEFMGEIPFGDVYLHGVVRDETARKMSKSLGNSPDPMDVMDKYGADALRFSMILITSQGQDAFYSEEKVQIGRNFANKVWNASRLVLMSLADAPDCDTSSAPAEDQLAAEDRWILSRLNNAIETVNSGLEGFVFNDAARAVYEFIWHEFCDWYLEIIKPRIYSKETTGPEAESRRTAQGVVVHVLGAGLRLLHPFAPYITEEIWQNLGKLCPKRGLPEAADAARSVMIAPWPQAQGPYAQPEIEAQIGTVQDIIRAIRNVRANMNVPKRKPLSVTVSVADAAAEKTVAENRDLLMRLAYVESLETGVDLPKPESSAAEVVGIIQIFVPLAGLIDLDVEREKTQKQLDAAEKQLSGIRARLANAAFLEKAPKHVVDRERERGDELEQRIAKLTGHLQELV